MPQIAKAEMYGVKDKIFDPSLPTEVEPFDLSFHSLKLTGSVGHSGNSLPYSRACCGVPGNLGCDVYGHQTIHLLPSRENFAASFALHLLVSPIIDLLRGPDEDAKSRQTLRKLVIIPSYLQSIPPDITPLLTFDSTGERLRFLMIHRLDSCRSLQYYPALKTFIYVSPINPNVCPFFTVHASPACHFSNVALSFGSFCRIYLVRECTKLAASCRSSQA
jgi:hypothetical protein